MKNSGLRFVALLVLFGVPIMSAGCGGGGPSPSQDSSLSALAVSAGVLSPGFSTGTTAYSTGVGLFAASVQLTPTSTDPGATILVNGTPVASGQPSGLVPLAIGPTPVAVMVTAAGGAVTTYTVVVTRAAAAVQQAYLKASNTDAGDSFGGGGHVAISGDTLVVEAPSESSSATGVNGNQADNSALQSGAAYVFVRTGATWTQQAYLKASNTQTADVAGDDNLTVQTNNTNVKNDRDSSHKRHYHY